MQVIVKDIKGNEVDVTTIYLHALEGKITREEYVKTLDVITGKSHE